ncbi:uncharacterized protein DNG_04731 [Cephalotrichum gorgonifer]|uniref:Uncharacterized protein n=1 Tax=Cephalotrichum gorgonifer TaxID=2041049 RepID=A0AAE8MXR7_9PEZI|nr:uncharacterized protein DNG_04731 [Cephalotrichum gorgonifer]
MSACFLLVAVPPHQVERLKAAPPGVKHRPALLTDPPSHIPRPTTITHLKSPTTKSSIPKASTANDTTPKNHASRPDLTVIVPVSYSEKARESMGTSAASHSPQTVAQAALPSIKPSSGDASSICQSPSWDSYGRGRKEKKQKGAAEKSLRSPRLVKPPPSASRTPQLWARTLAPLPLPPPPVPPKDEKPGTTVRPKVRGRSGSLGSIASVSSITSKIRSSLEIPRGRSATRESDTSFLGGIKLRKEKREEEMSASRLDAHNDTSYSLPARHMYRQPGGSGLGRSHSRSSSCSVASSSSLAPHFAPNPPVLSFPSPQRNRGPPVSLRKPAPISLRSRSASRSRSDSRSPAASRSGSPNGGEFYDGRGRSSSYGLTHQTDPTRIALDGSTSGGGRGTDQEDIGLHERSPMVGLVPGPGQTMPGECPRNEIQRTAPRGVNEPEYPPSASAYAFPYRSDVDGEQAEPQRRRRSSLLGSLRGHRPGGSEEAQVSDTPLQHPDDRTWPQSAARNFRDAARAAFQRSSSRVSSLGRRSISGASPVGSPTKETTNAFPDLTSANVPSNSVSAGASVPGLGPGSNSGLEPTDGPWPLRDVAKHFHRPRPIVDPNMMRPSDHSSISSYETSQSYQQSSTLTPDTSRPQSEKEGTVQGDGQKMLGGNERPALRVSPIPGAGLAIRNVATPPLAKKSSRRALRASFGPEANSPSPNSPATPTMSTPLAAHAYSPTVNGRMVRPEEAGARRFNPAIELDAEGTQVVLSPHRSISHTSPIEASMVPKPLNLALANILEE